VATPVPTLAFCQSSNSIRRREDDSARSDGDGIAVATGQEFLGLITIFSWKPIMIAEKRDKALCALESPESERNMRLSGKPDLASRKNFGK
jgi:hypothetical protein